MKYKVETRRSDRTGPCRRCGVQIQEGEHIARSEREFAHPSCVRMHIVNAPEPPRFLVGSQVGKICEGCGFTINEDDDYITVMALPWHKECRLRR